MTINGIDGINSGIQAGAPIGGSEDAVSKNLRRQISEAQKKLQELSSNTEMSPEQKSKKRQEIQKEIYELNNQLRQHQMEEAAKAENSQEKNQTDKKAEEEKDEKGKAKADQDELPDTTKEEGVKYTSVDVRL